MRYISLFLFVVVIGISSVAEGQKYDKSSPKYSEGQRVKQEPFDWSEKWPELGCDSERSCMELLAQYVEGGEGHVDLDVGPVFDEDPSSGPVTPRGGTAVGDRGYVGENGEWLAEIENQLDSFDPSVWTEFRQVVDQYVEGRITAGNQTALLLGVSGRKQSGGITAPADPTVVTSDISDDTIGAAPFEVYIEKIAALEAQLQAANEEITSLQIEDGIDNDYSE